MNLILRCLPEQSRHVLFKSVNIWSSYRYWTLCTPLKIVWILLIRVSSLISHAKIMFRVVYNNKVCRFRYLPKVMRLFSSNSDMLLQSNRFVLCKPRNKSRKHHFRLSSMGFLCQHITLTWQIYLNINLRCPLYRLRLFVTL